MKTAPVTSVEEARSQSLSDFSQNASQTLERLNQSDEAEVLTVDGQAKAVLISPAAYTEMLEDALLTRDVRSIRKSMEQYKRGEYVLAEDFFKQLERELMARKAQHDREKHS